jgi:hypothetical protein
MAACRTAIEDNLKLANEDEISNTLNYPLAGQPGLAGKG